MSDRTLLLTFHPASEEPPKLRDAYFVIDSGSPYIAWWTTTKDWPLRYESERFFWWDGEDDGLELNELQPSWWAEIPTDYQEWPSDE